MLRAALAASVAVLFVASFADTASAQVRKAKPAVKSQTKKDAAPKQQPFGGVAQKGQLLQIVVSIADQRLTLYADGKPIAQAPVSTGTPGHPTPYGIFSVIEKDRWHRSNLYGAAPMYYMHRLTWSGIALHEGVLPGRPASHGCIRLPTAFVSQLWAISKLGVRVVVAPRDTHYQEFAHAKLFNPKAKPSDSTPTATREPIGLRSSLDALPLRTQGQRVRVAHNDVSESGATTSDAGLPALQAPAALPPVAGEAPASASVTTDDTSAAAAPVAIKPAPSAEAEPAKPVDTTVTAAPAAAPAPAPVENATAAAPAPIIDVPATGTVTAAPSETPAADASATQSRVAAAEQGEPAKPAIDPEELTLPRPSPLRTRSAEPNRLRGQVAVFISRATKKIYVRQGFMPVFDMPVEIAEPERPLGTHLYTAMRLSDDGAQMQWNALSMPFVIPPGTPVPSRSKAAAKQQTNKKNAKDAKPAPKAEVKQASSAVEALDRITIPQEAIDRISEVLIPGSSLIISDEGLGRETGRYTEFIVETR